MRYLAGAIRGLALSALLVGAGCAPKDVGPINTLVPQPRVDTTAFIPDSGDDGSTIVGLAFSGGGMRASAFSYGVLSALDELVIDDMPYRRTMADNVRVVAGVSGGAVTATYFALKGSDAFQDFEQRFLLQNPESVMRTGVNPANVMRVLQGGANDRTTFRNWLDRNLFDGATFANLRSREHVPALWINASDVYNRTPFLFNEDTFAALCSDLDALKLADAVAASASFPVVFAPMVLEAPPADCPHNPPPWMMRALDDPNTSVRLHAYANALASYRQNPGIRYIKLLDGGLTDNLGITGLALARAAARTPYEPLSAEDAVKVRNLVFLVVDAGRGQTATWAGELHGPGISHLLQAVIDTNMTSGLRESLDALVMAMNDWKAQLIQYRCSLPLDTVRRIRGTTQGWNCRDVDVVVEHLAFTDLDQETEDRLNRIPTRLHLSPEDIALLVNAGRRVVFAHDSIMKVVADARRRAGIRDALQVSSLVSTH